MPPLIAVVVATNGARPTRLRWLLNALEEQDLGREAFEVVVAHDSADAEVRALLAGHPVAATVLRLAPTGPAAKRNAAWRAARAPVIAFTDDDCRAPAAWLRSMLEATDRHPGAVVQGTTRPDPDEIGVFEISPLARSQWIDPPSPMAQTCNIAYPRALLDAVGGFDETYPDAAGEDADLAIRARGAGGALVAAPEVLTYHAVETGLVARLRTAWRWQHLALLVRRHPELREVFPAGGYAWKASHVELLAAAAGLALARRIPLATLAAAPYVRRSFPRDPRRAVRGVLDLPGRAIVDAVELTALARGSIRHRTLLL